MKTFILFLLFSVLTIPQSDFTIKRITYMEADCRNLSNYKSYPFSGNKNYFVFEAHQNNSVNIILGEYSSELDSFIVLENITSNNYININPKITLGNNDTIYIVYQTNKNGNWDIACKILSNNNLSDEIYIANTELDETNPEVQYYSMNFMNKIWITYKREYSIYIKDLRSPDLPFELFQGSISSYYSNAVVGTSVFNSYVLAAAKLTQNVNQNLIAFKKMDFNGNWSDLYLIPIGGAINNLNLQNLNYELTITFDSRLEVFNNIYVVENLNPPYNVLKFKDEYDSDLFDFHSDHSFIVTLNEGIDVHHSHTFKNIRNDSLFIRVNYFDIIGFFNLDTLIYTKVNNSSLHLGSFGENLNGEIYYTVWEDSIDGRIQLFGRMGIEPLGNVENEFSPAEFSLKQNYPNPFNPVTVIQYTISNDMLSLSKHDDATLRQAQSDIFVSLKVYDILGNEITTLVNENKPAGKYSVKFDGSSLPSGVYFYRIQVNNFVESKKMILMK